VFWPPAETRMIRLAKGPVPGILVRRGEAWRAEYLRRLDLGGVRRDLPARYRHVEVKAALRVESQDKCMYCETLVSHAQYGDIDHYLPVSVCPDLVVSWSNLGFTCEMCNTNKGDYWDQRFPLVNPYAEDPSHFLMFAGPIAMHQPGSLRGKVTIERIGLNRDELIARRMERLERVLPLVDAVALMPAGMARGVMLDVLAEEMGPDAEYSATIAAHLAPFIRRSTAQAALGS
jgi:5-methylcytosine-specific restriction endonuclease McrA